MENEESKPNKNITKKGMFTNAEIDFIIRNIHLTDEEIGKALNRNPKGLNRKRNELGLNKKEMQIVKGKTEEIVDQTIKKRDNLVTSPKQREEFFYNQFKHDHYYQQLNDGVLTENEMEFYMKEWAVYMAEVDTLTSPERRMLHELIMCQIDLMRYRRELMAMQMGGHNDPKVLMEIKRGIENSQGSYLKLSKDLKISREQRLQGKIEGGMTLTRLIREMQSEENRSRIGNFGGALEIAAKNIKKEWQKMGILKNGDQIENEEKGKEKIDEKK